jgi:micrococcal nuclease
VALIERSNKLYMLKIFSIICILTFSITQTLFTACNYTGISSTRVRPTTASPVVPSNSITILPTNYVSAQVVRVIDGDTIKVNISGLQYTVRFIGIDAPETVKPNGTVEPFGPEASAKNKELVEGKVVLLEKDISDTDQYGRLLRYVYVDDLFVNAELVRLGYAQAITYPPDIKYQDLLRHLQEEARDAGRGLWGNSYSLNHQIPISTSGIWACIWALTCN